MAKTEGHLIMHSHREVQQSSSYAWPNGYLMISHGTASTNHSVFIGKEASP